MLKKATIFLILFLTNVLFADIQVLEKINGRIVVRVNLSAPVYRESMQIPVQSLSFTAAAGSQPQVSATPQNRFTMRVPENLGNETVSPTVNFTFARSIPLFSAEISPILSINGNEITYTTEMIVVISYSAGQNRNLVPRNSFYDAVSSAILNADRIPNTVFQQRAPRSSGSINNITADVALRFSIGDRPTVAQSHQEAFRHPCPETDVARGAGIYRITRSDLELLERRLGTQIPINQIRIRSSNPNIVNDTTPSIAELIDTLNGLVDVPFVVRKGSPTGNPLLFEDGDEILFYAEKIHTWRFDDSENVNDWRFFFNFTDFRRYYWITVEPNGGSNRMNTIARLPEPSAPLREVGDVYFRGNRSTQLTTGDVAQGHGDKRWVWTTLTNQNENTRVFNSVNFPNSFIVNHIKTENADIRFFAHELNRSGLASLVFSVAPAGDTTRLTIQRANLGNWHSFPSASQFSLRANFLGAAENPFSPYFDFDGFDLRYRQRLSLFNAENQTRRHSLQFYSPPRPDRNGPQTAVRYRISDLPPNEFRMLVRHNPRTQITELIDSGSTSATYLEFSSATGNGFKYHLATQSGFRSVENMQQINIAQQNVGLRIVDLLNTSNRVDYLIIAPQEFLQQAQDLAQHKQSIGMFQFPRVVSTDDIFRVFSGGVFSPEAIRNFMVYVQNMWGAAPFTYPNYLVLFGNGHYDFKNIRFPLLSHPNHIPLYIAVDSDYPIFTRFRFVSYQIEDFFAYTQAGMIAGNIAPLSNPQLPAAFPQFAVGRIPVNDAREANAYLQKVKNTEGAQADFSSWRNRHLFVADDDSVPRSSSAPQGIENSFSMAHTRQSDIMANIAARMDSSADIRKITLFEFPFDNQGDKPLARNALIREINNGVSLVSFFGHGSHSQLADENIFHTRDVPSLINTKRYFVFLALSCAVGYFGDPATLGLSELLVRAQGGGAIAAISASRISWPVENEPFAVAFFTRFYDSTRIGSVSIGGAYIAAKTAAGLTIRNIPTYTILGDPSHIPMQERLMIPTANIRILDENRNEINAPLKKMQNVIIRATLPIPNDQVRRTAEIILQNPENTSPSRRDGIVQFPNNEHWGANVQYRLPGLIATRRVDTTIVGNVVEIPFMIPPTVLEDTLGSAIRIHVHSATERTIFSGSITDGIIFSGFDTTNININDSIGPVIAVRHIIGGDTNHIVSDRIVIDGFDRGREQRLYFRISDMSGVDIYSAQSPGGGISVSIDRAMSRRQFGTDDAEVRLFNEDFREVSLNLPLLRSKFPSTGEYELTISARDILQNITTRRFILDIRSLGNEQYAIGDFFAYPSPVRMGQRTRFFFNQPTDNVADISLKIYTLNGRLVRSFSNVQRGVEWDLTDQRGQQLSPNVYLYRLFVRRYRRDDGQHISSSPQTEVIRSRVRKMVIHPPR
ncbi:MAG: C25 family cysteine peptidase [Chitinivibrionia bacterium]|nr:C25 family cysteine peptidase [Chitinivibrionia bacterium]